MRGRRGVSIDLDISRGGGVSLEIINYRDMGCCIFFYSKSMAAELLIALIVSVPVSYCF